MHRSPAGRLGAAALTGLVLVAAPLRADTAAPSPRLSDDVAAKLELIRAVLSQEQSHVVREHIVSLGPGVARLTFVYEDGGQLELALDRGQVLLDGRLLGHHPTHGALETDWATLLGSVSQLPTPDALDQVRGWVPDGLSHDEQAWAELFRDRLGSLTAPTGLATVPHPLEPAGSGGLVIPLDNLESPDLLALFQRAATLRGDALRVTVPGGRAHVGHFGLGSTEQLAGHLLVLHGDADVFGHVDGNVATVDGDIVVHPGAVITGDVLAVSGEVRDVGGDIHGRIRTAELPTVAGSVPRHAEAVAERSSTLIRNAAGVTGVFLTLLLVGFGLVLFGRPPLEVMSDTALHSFGRAFAVGLLGQMLVIPTFGAILVGLVLSVAGVLLVPFAILVFGLLFIAAVLGGFLAMAHAMGETVTRRQLARGLAISHANSYRYMAVGLISVAALWYAWVAFGWVPVAGTVVAGMAALVTWLLATVGFGAALLSRVGLREHFAGRLIPQEALTDEYLWATPQFGVTAVKRPERTPVPRR